MIKSINTSLRTKIFLGFTIILFTMFLVTVWSIFNFYKIGESINITMQENYRSIIAADNIGKSLDEQLYALIVIINGDFENGNKLLSKSKENFYYWYNQARMAAFTKEERDVLDSLNSQYSNFLTYWIPRIDFRKNSGHKNGLIINDLFLIVNQIKSLKEKSNEILEINHKLLNEAIQQTKTIIQTATFFILVTLFGTIAVSILFSRSFSNYLVRPINKLRETVEQISEGHFNKKIEIDEKSEEISGLAEEFNKMIERLQHYEQLNLNKILFEKKKSELVIENITEPVVMIDNDLNILLSNQAFNITFKDFISDKSKLEKLLIISEEKQDNKKNFYFDKDTLIINQKDGTQKYFKLIKAVLEIPEKEMRGAVYLFHDITKYRELDKMKSEFIAKVSHEFKTPLTTLGMAIGMLEDEIAGKLNKKLKEIVISMKEDYERLNKLVYEMLELTKLKMARENINFELFPVTKLLTHISKKFTALAREKNIELKIYDNSRDALMKGSYSHMISAIENIVNNSLKFTPSNGTIAIRLELKDNKINIIVSDTGIGITPDNLERIFDKFVQITDMTPGSLGLGLSIAKEIIEMHNGEIKVYSEMGKGSTFHIILPISLEKNE